MKKILLLAVLLLVAASQMQAKGDKEEVKIVLVKEENSDNYYYEGVVPVEGISKEEMFKRAKDWVLSNFKTGDNNVDFNETDLSIHNGTTIKFDGIDELMNFKMSIYFKDGKYKFHFDNVLVLYYSSQNGRLSSVPYRLKAGPTKKLIKKCNETLFKLSIDLENAIKGNTAKKDDW